MGYFYLDDSKHSQHGFFLSSFVYRSSNPQSDVEQILLRHGLHPGMDEFKSSAPMRKESASRAVRNDLRDYIRSCKVGVAISATESELYKDSATLLSKMLSHPKIDKGENFIFLDQGIAPKAREQEAFRSVTSSERCQFHFEQDSKTVCGIQLADQSAHICATMMKDSMGLITKTVKAGENSGYDPDLDIELGFEMFARIRYSFLGVCAPYVWEDPRPPVQPLLMTSDYGLQISDSLDDNIKPVAESRFGSLYLGCVH